MVTEAAIYEGFYQFGVSTLICHNSEWEFVICMHVYVKFGEYEYYPCKMKVYPKFDLGLCNSAAESVGKF